MDVTAEVFKHLDQWRHFPAYALERRADIYFGLVLPEIMKQRFELAGSVTVIPEFPLSTPFRKFGDVFNQAASASRGWVGGRRCMV